MHKCVSEALTMKLWRLSRSRRVTYRGIIGIEELSMLGRRKQGGPLVRLSLLMATGPTRLRARAVSLTGTASILILRVVPVIFVVVRLRGGGTPDTDHIAQALPPRSDCCCTSRPAD